MIAPYKTPPFECPYSELTWIFYKLVYTLTSKVPSTMASKSTTTKSPKFDLGVEFDFWRHCGGAMHLHAVCGGDTIAGSDEASSTDERVAAAGSSSLDLDVPRPWVGLSLHSADYSHEDIRFNAGNAALVGVLALRARVIVVFVEKLHHDINRSNICIPTHYTVSQCLKKRPTLSFAVTLTCQIANMHKISPSTKKKLIVIKHTYSSSSCFTCTYKLPVTARPMYII